MLRIAQGLLLLLVLGLQPILTAGQETAVEGVEAPNAEAVPFADEPVPATAVEEEWDLGPVSAAGQRQLDRVRDSVLQIRGFYGDSPSEAFHGSGFVVGEVGLVATNYHVVSRAALDPGNVRLGYRADDGRTGSLAILAIDVENDLALLRAEGLESLPLKLQLEAPAKGDRAYAIGYPLNLGLVITEGIANGRLDNTFSPRLHFAGPMNPGMSGGPALDSKGRVFGINVSFSTRGQLVSFLIPAEFMATLLGAESPPNDLPGEVARQIENHQTRLLEALPRSFPTQASGGYALPAELAPFVDCTAASARAPSRLVRMQSVSCRGYADIFVQPGLTTGDFRFNHRVLIAPELAPIRFSEQLTTVARTVEPPEGVDWHVAPFACKSSTVLLSGLRAQVQLCVRSYLHFEGLYDFSMVVVSRHRERQGFVSDLSIRGMSYDSAIELCRRYLKAMKWNR